MLVSARVYCFFEMQVIIDIPVLDPVVLNKTWRTPNFFTQPTHATADYFVVMDNFPPVTVEWRKLYSIMGISFAKRVVYGLCFVLETTWNTLPATNIAPENQWFEDEFPSAMACFQRPCQFQGVYHYKSSYDIILDVSGKILAGFRFRVWSSLIPDAVPHRFFPREVVFFWTDAPKLNLKLNHFPKRNLIQGSAITPKN